MKNKKTPFIIVIILAVAVGYFYLDKYYFQERPEDKVWTAEDFPNVVGLDSESLRLTLEDLNKQYQKIKEDSYVYIRWINIGILKKRLNDYQGAEQAWLSAIEYNPDQALAFGNLADLYLYDLQKYEQAEEYYKKVLTMQPDVYNHYFGLASLYRYNLPEKAGLIEDLMNDGAKLNSPPYSATFYMYLANYFAEGSENNGGNDLAKTRLYTQKALEIDPNLKDQLPEL